MKIGADWRNAAQLNRKHSILLFNIIQYYYLRMSSFTITKRATGLFPEHYNMDKDKPTLQCSLPFHCRRQRRQQTTKNS